MMNPNDKPKVVVKKKYMQPVIEYCIENSVEFAVKHKPLPDDEWEIELNITNVKKGILFGMFLRENRMYLAGMEPVAAPVQKTKKVAVPKKEDATSETTEDTEEKSDPENTLF